MSNLLQMQEGAKAYGTRSLFEKASFSINAGEHVGVIGPNGAGKSTLLKILIGQEHLDHGKLVEARGLRVGYLAQHDLWAPGTTVEQFLATETLLPLWELKSLGRGLGLREDQYPQPLDALSGGYRTRVKLLRLLGQMPDLLLLDEPTNYLDLESVLVLENFLQESRSAFLLVSHDREFLRRTTDHILEVEAGEVTKYNGSLDDYFEQKELLRTQLEARALSLAEKRQSVLDFVNRFGAKASKARQAQSRLKSLDRMESIEIKALPNTAKIQIPPPRHCGKTVLSAKNLSLGYGAKRVLQGLNFDLNRGEHLAVVGVNGAGKSTLLKALAGKLEPLEGQLQLGYEVSLGYYAQHVAEALDPQASVLQAIGARAHPDVSSQQILNLAGSLLFSGDDVQKKIQVLSGGEKSRVALGQILLERAPFLVLDEPTNHLDFQTVEALTEALKNFEGTVVVVSHDRSFIRRVGTKILEVRNGRAEVYPGSYDEYVWSVQKGVLSSRTPAAAPAAKKALAPAPSAAPNTHREIRRLEKELSRVEKRIAQQEEELKSLHQKMAEESASKELGAWAQAAEEIQNELTQLEQEWMKLGTELESFKRH